MNTADLLTYLEGRKDEMLTFSKALVEHESPSLDKQAVDRMGLWLRRIYTDLGGKAEVYPARHVGDTLKITMGEGDGQALVLCHMDTVWPLGEVNRRPFRVEGDRAYGPGLYDMKAGFLFFGEALGALRHFGIRPKKRIVLLCNSDEEIGSLASRETIEMEAQRSDYVLVLEPSTHGGAVKTTRKGQASLILRAQGVPSHSGSDFEQGANAIEELSKHVLAMRSLGNPSSGTTVNVGVIRGGSRSNVVAAEAYAEVDVRAVSSDELDSVTEAIKALRPTNPRVSLTISGGILRPPMTRSPEITLMYQKARALAEGIGFLLPEASTGASSDGNLTAHLGIPTLDGLGAVGWGSHAIDEYIVVSRLPQRIALLVKILQTF